MDCYRGPKSQPFWNDDDNQPNHNYLTSISSDKLRQAIEKDDRIKFELNTQKSSNQSVCSIELSDNDIVQMFYGLISKIESKIKDQQSDIKHRENIIESIVSIVGTNTLTADEKISKIQQRVIGRY